jgi:hypothetical protein
MNTINSVATAVGIFSCIVGTYGIFTETDELKKINYKIALLGGVIAISNALNH